MSVSRVRLGLIWRGGGTIAEQLKKTEQPGEVCVCGFCNGIESNDSGRHRVFMTTDGHDG